jgi:hypothetical protein
LRTYGNVGTNKKEIAHYGHYPTNMKLMKQPPVVAVPATTHQFAHNISLIYSLNGNEGLVSQQKETTKTNLDQKTYLFKSSCILESST